MKRDGDSRSPEWRARLFDFAPRGISAATFACGALSLISAAIPSGTQGEASPLAHVIAEAPGLGLAVGSLALMTLSLGLLRRLRMAWALSLLAAFHGLLATVLFRPRPIEAAMWVLLIALLMAARRSFYRRSSLHRLALSRVWFLGTGLAIAIAGFFSLLWISHQKGFIEARFIDLVIDPALGAAGRPIALALALLGLVALHMAAAQPYRPRPTVPSDADFDRLTRIVETGDHPRPDNVLAYVGDKSLFYSPDGGAALAYAEAGGIRIAMGPPIGPKVAWRGVLEAFRKDAEEKALRPAVYSATPDLLPDLLDLGFRMEKIGENAILDLSGFSLSGSKREAIRRSRRKLAERSGATFQLAEPPHADRLIARLQTVSDAWLEANGAREKAFSLGRFERRFLNQCPIGVVEIQGRTVAFGSLLTTHDKSWAGIDLMRFDPNAAVTNTMDFLLVELILWAKGEGFQRFDLAMAPLSGLVQDDVAPLYARIGQFIFERGERFYNFQGIRRFKQKFDPDWEPRYIAAPGYWSLPIVLALVGRLTNSDRQ